MKVKDVIKLLEKCDQNSHIGICDITNDNVVSDFTISEQTKFYKYSSKKKDNLVYLQVTNPLGYREE